MKTRTLLLATLMVCGTAQAAVPNSLTCQSDLGTTDYMIGDNAVVASNPDINNGAPYSVQPYIESETASDYTVYYTQNDFYIFESQPTGGIYKMAMGKLGTPIVFRSSCRSNNSAASNLTDLALSKVGM